MVAPTPSLPAPRAQACAIQDRLDEATVGLVRVVASRAVAARSLSNSALADTKLACAPTIVFLCILEHQCQLSQAWWHRMHRFRLEKPTAFESSHRVRRKTHHHRCWGRSRHQRRRFLHSRTQPMTRRTHYRISPPLPCNSIICPYAHAQTTLLPGP